MNTNCALTLNIFIHMARVIKSQKRKRQKAFLMLMKMHDRKVLFNIIGRSRNLCRDRCAILEKISRMSDEYFKRFFRMDRSTFGKLLSTIESRIAKNTTKAENSSGFPVHPSLKLSVALRVRVHQIPASNFGAVLKLFLTNDTSGTGLQLMRRHIHHTTTIGRRHLC